MNNSKTAAPSPRLNQDIPFDLKLDIESLVTAVTKHRKQRVNQKDLIVEILQAGVISIQKKLK